MYTINRSGNKLVVAITCQSNVLCSEITVNHIMFVCTNMIYENQNVLVINPDTNQIKCMQMISRFALDAFELNNS